MQKPALCFRRQDLPNPQEDLATCSIPDNLYELKTHLADRVGYDSCEEMPSLQQIIPYLILRDGNLVFCYSRGQAGGEDKLKAKLSIGLGGHVDAAPPKDNDLKQWLIAEARRELEEEVGLTDNVAIEFSALLFDRQHFVEPTNKDKIYVGQVHVGLLSVIECARDQLNRHEDGVIEKGTWLTLEDLLLPEIFNRLEPWSQQTVIVMTKQILNIKS